MKLCVLGAALGGKLLDSCIRVKKVSIMWVLEFQYYILLTNIVGEIERNSTRTAVESLYSILLILIDKTVINKIYMISIHNKL